MEDQEEEMESDRWRDCCSFCIQIRTEEILIVILCFFKCSTRVGLQAGL